MIFRDDMFTEGEKGKVPPIIASFAFVIRQALPPHPNACGLSPHPYKIKIKNQRKEKNEHGKRKKENGQRTDDRDH